MNFHGKRDLLCRLIRDHNVRSFVETGTYEARMTLAMAEVVPDVRTIELSESLHKENIERLGREKLTGKVTLICGHSAKQLPYALEGAERPLVWLDAHWSAGKTTRDDSGSDTPIVEELRALKEWGGEAVVAVDDIRCFDGNNGYPTLGVLSDLIVQLWPDAKPVQEDDVVWFIAKA